MVENHKKLLQAVIANRHLAVKQSQLTQRTASLRFTSLAMTAPKNWFLECTHA